MTEKTVEISDVSVYTTNMSKSILDKLFFADKISDDIEAIVDFGCADGSLISFMSVLFPKYLYIGYDENAEMITLAKEKNQKKKNVCFTTNWNEVFEILRQYNISLAKTVLNVSSVVHEVYSYKDKNGVKEFWNMVFKSGFRFIAIRDMNIDKKTYNDTTDPDLEDAIVKKYTQQVSDFENGYFFPKAPTCIYFNAIHFLMKRKYVENWEREVRENYSPVDLKETVDNLVKDTKYTKIWERAYVLPYFQRSVREEFGFNITDNTHYQVLFENNKKDRKKKTEDGQDEEKKEDKQKKRNKFFFAARFV